LVGTKLINKKQVHLAAIPLCLQQANVRLNKGSFNFTEIFWGVLEDCFERMSCRFQEDCELFLQGPTAEIELLLRINGKKIQLLK
jgi:hypothetical protein